MRNAEDDPLEHGIHKDTHQQEVGHGLEPGSQEFSPKAPMKEDPIQIRRPSRPCVGQATPDTEDGRYRGLQDETESTGAGEPSGDVFEERSQKQVDPPSVKGVR